MKTIIIYSTKYGSVRKAAMKLIDHLKGEVTIADVKTLPVIDDHDTVVLGGSVYAGNIQKEMRLFIKNNLDKLITKRIGLFICAGTPKEEVVTSYLRKCYPEELYDRALAKGNFGYEYDLEKFSFFDRLIVRIVGVKKSQAVYHEDCIKEFGKLVI